MITECAETAEDLFQVEVNIFSDSNIDYKIAQQLGKYKCYGSIILDLSSPISDLSHVETVEDIIGAIILAIL